MKKLKAGVILLVFLFSCTHRNRQDLTDQKNFDTLKNIKSFTSDKKNGEYCAILNNNFLLHTKYYVLEDNQQNSTYTFIFFPDDPDAPDHSKEILLKNLPYMLETLGIDGKYLDSFKSDINKAFSEASDTDKANVLIDFSFLKSYDQFNLQFRNEDNYITCEFFFERMF